MYLKRSTLNVTQRCTLNCKLCLAFIPYYEHPTDLPLDSAEKVIDRYFEIVDKVGTFCITGGEPLMNKDITAIMKKLASHSDQILEHIDMVTNGTLDVPEDLLTALEPYREKARIIISNYGSDLSKKIESIKKAVSAHGLVYRVQEYSPDGNWLYDGWIDFTDHSLKHKTIPEVEASAKKCLFRQGHYYVINDGILYPCPRLHWRTHEGIVSSSQCIDLLNGTQSVQADQAKLSELENLVYLDSCAYCYGNNETVPRHKPAEQLK